MIDIFDKAKVAASIEGKIVSTALSLWRTGAQTETMPNEYEKQWASFLLQQGVDVVIGGHPHVLQPYGIMSYDKGNEMVIFFIPLEIGLNS